MNESRITNRQLPLFVGHWSLLILTILALCLVAIRPWMRQELVCSDDISLHLLRTAQLEALLRQGVLYSRWAPDMALGYGYPFYNFYAPLSYYIAAVLALTGLGTLRALFVTFALAPVSAALGAYLLARDHFSLRSALVAATAYAYAPYLAYDAYFRGNLAETFGWVFPPFALWAIGRLARRNDWRYVALTALAYAAILLTHNVFALIFSPLLIAYGLTMTFAIPFASTRLRRLIAVISACLLGLGLAAFFWLPALAERTYVHSDRLLVPPTLVYWNNFIDWRELFALPRAIHPDLMNPSPMRGLSLVPTLLGLPALVGLWRFRDRPRRAQVVFFAAALVLYAWLTTASSRFVWDHLPLIEYVQFPWRLLGPAALCLGMLIGAAADLLPADRRGSLAAASITLVLILGSLFWLDPRYCPWGASFSSADTIVAFEHHTHFIGTTVKGEYLPRAVELMPEDATTPLVPSSVPTDTVVAERETVPIGAELLVTTPRPFTATYNGFYYPGWRVTIDGQAVPIAIEPLYGRITFRVPAGNHRISIRFGETPLRRAADLVSGACLVLTLGLLLCSRVFHNAGVEWNPRLQVRNGICWMLWGLALFGLVTLLYRVDTPLRHPALREGRLPGLDVELNVPFEGGLTLLGFDRPQQMTVPSGGHIRLDLFWTVREKPSQRYQHTINILDSAGLRWNRLDTLPPRNFREPPDTWLWEPGLYAQGSHYIEPLPGTPPGIYHLSLVLFDLETLAPLRVLEAGQPGPPALPLGQITVMPPMRSPDPDEVGMQHRLNVDLGALTLVGVDLDRAEAVPGDPFLITFYWRTDETPAQDLSVRLSLLAADGTEAAAFDLPPTFATHPTTTWQAGDFWRGQHLLRLPARLEEGDYTWRLTLLPNNQSTNLPTPIHITALPRTFTAPPIQHAVSTTLGGLATLVGFDLSAETIHAGEALTVTLIWRAEAETSISYRVFLHLTGPEGQTVAQSDGEPANWTRPTTGWLPGEHVADVRVLTIPADAPPGPYTLSTGLYVLGGGRLTTSDGGDTTSLIAVLIP